MWARSVTGVHLTRDKSADEQHGVDWRHEGERHAKQIDRDGEDNRPPAAHRLLQATGR